MELGVKVSTSKVGKMGFSGGILFSFGEPGEAKVMRSTFQLTNFVPPKSAFASEVLPVRVNPYRPKAVSLVIRNPWKFDLCDPEIRLDADVGKATFAKSVNDAKGPGQEFLAEISFSEAFLSKLRSESQNVALVLLGKQNVGSMVSHEIDATVLNVTAESDFAAKGVHIDFDGDSAKVSVNLFQSSKNGPPLAECDFEFKLNCGLAQCQVQNP